jgi:hypothetical protein
MSVDDCFSAFDTWRRVYRVNIGTHVRILRGFDSDESGCKFVYLHDMHREIGNIGVIRFFHFTAARVDTHNLLNRSWPFFCLEVIKQD